MSDERFDQDLRSVLMEDGPGDVPAELRRRVAAVPSMHPIAARTSPMSWMRSASRLVGSAAALAIVAAALVIAFGLTRPTPGPEPGVGASTSAPPSTAPSQAASAGTAAGGACQAADLTGVILGWQGAAGSRIADVELRSHATGLCIVRGTPGLELLTADGRVLIDSSAAGSSGKPHVGATDPTFQVSPGGRLKTQVQASNYCGAAASGEIDIAFTLPNGGRLVARPGTGVSSSEAVPPCMGTVPSSIAMNGWRR